MTFQIALDRTLEKTKMGILPTVFRYIISPLRTATPALSKLEIFPQRNTFRKKPTQMHTNHYPDLFVTHSEDFNMNAGNKNPFLIDEDPLFTQS